MNLPNFLQQVDQMAAAMSTGELRSFVHETARTLPESRRDDYLKAMRNAQIDSEKGSQKGSPKAHSQNEELSEEIKQSMELLESVCNGDLRLDSEYNEEWDEWYNSDEEEILFSDPEHILPGIENALDLIHKCLDMEVYSEGYSLVQAFCELSVSVDGDYSPDGL